MSKKITVYGNAQDLAELYHAVESIPALVESKQAAQAEAQEQRARAERAEAYPTEEAYLAVCRARDNWESEAKDQTTRARSLSDQLEQIHEELAVTRNLLSETERDRRNKGAALAARDAELARVREALRGLLDRYISVIGNEGIECYKARAALSPASEPATCTAAMPCTECDGGCVGEGE